jgi:hypothetical protein
MINELKKTERKNSSKNLHLGFFFFWNSSYLINEKYIKRVQTYLKKIEKTSCVRSSFNLNILRFLKFWTKNRLKNFSLGKNIKHY